MISKSDNGMKSIAGQSPKIIETKFYRTRPNNTKGFLTILPNKWKILIQLFDKKFHKLKSGKVRTKDFQWNFNKACQYKKKYHNTNKQFLKQQLKIRGSMKF